MSEETRKKHSDSMRGKNMRPKSEETRLKISKTLTGHKFSEESIKKRTASFQKTVNSLLWRELHKDLRVGKNNGMYGKHHTNETKKKLSEIITQAMNRPEVKNHLTSIRKSQEYKQLRSNIFKGKIRGIEHCRNLRLAHIKRIEAMIRDGLPMIPRFNKRACKIIDEYGNTHGYKFVHALNGGEYRIKDLGYWVDGYDKEKNVVIEIDESYHYGLDGNLREKDIQRQREIEEYLGCKFIRIPLKEK